MSSLDTEGVIPMSTAVTAVPPRPIVEKITEPTSLDVCDRCGANALWRVVLASGNSLSFCGHHGVLYGFVNGSDSHHAYMNEDKKRGSANS